MPPSISILFHDTYIGSALQRALTHAPSPTSEVLFFAHDVASSFHEHIASLDACCRRLVAAGRPVIIVYPSSANICECRRGRIRENSTTLPHCDRERAICDAEALLRSFAADSRGLITPLILRHGELYGDAPVAPISGHLNSLLSIARAGRPLPLPGLGLQKRTLTHIDDFAAAALSLLAVPDLPTVVNIPGETSSIIDYSVAVATRYSVDIETSAPVFDDNITPFAPSRLLSNSLFKSLSSFTPKHSFARWLQLTATQTA